MLTSESDSLPALTTPAAARSVVLDVPSQLFRIAVLVLPGAVLLVVPYSLDYPYPDLGAYPAHVWSTALAIAGFWLLLAALVLISGDSLSPWVALFSAVAIGNVGTISDGLIVPSAWSWIGVFGTSLVALLAASSLLLKVFGWRHWGRALVGSLVLSAIGVVGFALNAAFPKDPIWAGPPGLVMALFVATPVFVLLKKPGLWSGGSGTQRPEPPTSVATPGPEHPWVATPAAAPSVEAGSLFTGGVFGDGALTAGGIEPPKPEELTLDDRRRFGPPKRTWLGGCPWWGWVYLLTFLWSVGDVELPLRMIGLGDPWLTVAAIVVVVVVGTGIVVLAPKLRTWAQLWLDSTSRIWTRLDSRAFALQKSASSTLESDPNLAQAATLYGQALALAETGGRPLLLAAACNNLASVYAQQNRARDAIPYLERALQLRTAYAGASNDATVSSIQRLAKAYSAAGRQAEADQLNARFS